MHTRTPTHTHTNSEKFNVLRAGSILYSRRISGDPSWMILKYCKVTIYTLQAIFFGFCFLEYKTVVYGNIYVEKKSRIFDQVTSSIILISVEDVIKSYHINNKTKKKNSKEP